MYDELVKRLRAAAIMSEALSIFLPHSEGSAVAKLYNEAADAIEELSATISKMEIATRWIPVTERLPELHEEVLVCTEEYGETVLGFAMVAVFDGTGWLEAWERKTYLAAVTHWMPLPEPPKEE